MECLALPVFLQSQLIHDLPSPSNTNFIWIRQEYSTVFMPHQPQHTVVPVTALGVSAGCGRIDAS